MDSAPLGNMNHAQQNKFKLIFNKLPRVEFFCTSIQLPGVNVDVSNISIPTMSVPYPSSRITYDQLSITYSLDEEWETWESLFNWLRGFGRDDGYVPEDESEGLDNASIELLTNVNNPLHSIYFEGIFPTTVESPNMGYESSSDIFLTATFAIQGFSFTRR